MKSKYLFILTILFTVLWMGVIFSFSNASSDESNDSSMGVIRYVVKKIYRDKDDSEIEKIVIKVNKPFRKLAHASVYFVLANFICSIVIVFKDKIKMCIIISLIICFLFACTDEWHQTFINQRTGQFSDVLIDTLGALVGCFVFNMIIKKIRKSKKRVI